jgi:hypothetical protein
LLQVEAPKEHQGGPLSKSLSSRHITESAIIFTKCTYYGLQRKLEALLSID